MNHPESPTNQAPAGVLATVKSWIDGGLVDRLPSKIEGETDGLVWAWNEPAKGLADLVKDVEKQRNVGKKVELLKQLRELAQDVRAYFRSQGIES